MDFVKNLAGGNNNANNNTEGQQAPPEAGGGFMDKVNGMAGGGAQGEKNEDGLDKAVDFVQEKFLGGGDQSNESAAEQAKDEAISDAIRDQYKSATGSEFPISDKDKKYGA
ncbi:DNA damage-responsive 48 [Fusarium pseudocircinatum]|uniref:DNA damage-responsive 48 n=1 Tax=Fusarium pseudocircinatum TaxID=56676 RepID=A0A8H5UR81_9HYPO|nr:DNA damage-responsive 48 [Fusarium pseudocircinatum]